MKKETKQKKYIQAKFKNTNEVWKKLKISNIKKTWVRQEIVKLFFKENHWTIKQIVNALVKKNKNINLASIYNTITMLLENYIIVCYSFEGTEQIYELDSKLSFHVFFEDHKNLTESEFKEVKPSEELYDSILKEARTVISDKNMVPLHIKVQVHILKTNKKEI